MSDAVADRVVLQITGVGDGRRHTVSLRERLVKNFYHSAADGGGGGGAIIPEKDVVDKLTALQKASGELFNELADALLLPSGGDGGGGGVEKGGGGVAVGRGDASSVVDAVASAIMKLQPQIGFRFLVRNRCRARMIQCRGMRCMSCGGTLPS